MTRPAARNSFIPSLAEIFFGGLANLLRARRARRRAGLRRIQFQSLEPRILLSADLVGASVEHLFPPEILVGGEGDDRLYGGNGDGSLDGGAGDDNLRGHKGDDTLLGGLDDDHLRGDAGNDLLDGGAGSDLVDGGTDDDVAVYRMAENLGAHDQYEGGRGFDTLELVLTPSEFALTSVQQDIANFRAFLAGNADPDHDNGPVFHFLSFDLDASDFEALKITAPAAFSFAFLTPTTSVGEAGGTASLTVVLTTDAPLSGDVMVDLAALGTGSATLGTDYTFASPTTLTFAAGSVTGATQSAAIVITSDRAVEASSEAADFSFGNIRTTGLDVNVGAATGSHTLFISDDDSASVAITTPGTTGVSEGGGSANVGVTLTLDTSGTVGTAQLDVQVSANLPGNGDYTATAALFDVGAVSGATANVVVTAVNDRNVEQSTESFAGQSLSLTSAANASASTSQTIVVSDNDSASVAITAPGTTGVSEGGGSANVGVTLTLDTSGTVGTAQLDVTVSANLPGNGDYTATAALFDVGAVSGATANVVVTAVNDRNVEQSTESFAGQSLSLTSAANASASTSQTIVVSDNDSASVAITTPGTTGVSEGGG